MIIPVILAGGSGTRLWPLSRELYPKQFLSLAATDHSLFEQTLMRLTGLPDLAEPIVIAREEHRFLVAEQARRAGYEKLQIILEPVGRNTAPAVAVAAWEAIRQAPDSLLLVLPSDHAIDDMKAFARAVASARTAALASRLATFGIEPSAPETGYGYIKIGDAYGDGSFLLSRFVEKPDEKTAREYLAQGGYYWNSGMFLFRADVYLNQLKLHAPDIHAATQKAHAGMKQDSYFMRVEGEAFAGCRSDSIDYAVMEKTADAVVVKLESGWSDLGNWNAVAQIDKTDEDGNVLQGDVLGEDLRDCYVRSDGRLVAALGLNSVVIIETKDALLVADRARLQDVKKIVQKLEGLNRSEMREHCRVYRPWGFYEDLAKDQGYRVKHIQVKPGGQLSLQMHHKRAEHWVVLRGTAKVTCGEKSMLLEADQSTYIPMGTKHRLENPGTVPLELIEVQTGAYVGEDDIVRFEDVYGRSTEVKK